MMCALLQTKSIVQEGKCINDHDPKFYYLDREMLEFVGDLPYKYDNELLKADECTLSSSDEEEESSIELRPKEI